MKGILKIEKENGEIVQYKVEVLKVQLHGLTDLRLNLEGKNVRFQYDNRNHHSYAKEGFFQKGYLITKPVQDCWFKFKN